MGDIPIADRKVDRFSFAPLIQQTMEPALGSSVSYTLCKSLDGFKHPNSDDIACGKSRCIQSLKARMIYESMEVKSVELKFVYLFFFLTGRIPITFSDVVDILTLIAYLVKRVT